VSTYRLAGVGRFLFSSSCSLYGAGGDVELDEHAAFYPVTAYGESKVRVEQQVSTLADDRFSPVYLRNATAYGVSRRLRADIVVNNLVGYALTTGKVMMMSDGSPWRPLVHIGDISRGVLAALTAPADAVRNQAFNIGRTRENFRIREVAEMVAEIVPDCEVSFAPGASPDARNYRVDFGKAEKSLPGYTPQWTLRAGIEVRLVGHERTVVIARREQQHAAQLQQIEIFGCEKARGDQDPAPGRTARAAGGRTLRDGSQSRFRDR